MITERARWSIGLLASVLAACAAREVLIPKPGEPPPGINFSGLWTLRFDADAERRRLDRAIGRTEGIDRGPLLPPPETRGQRGDRGFHGGRRHDSGGLVHVFLQQGRQLKITQTARALFISFDRAVVEEFRFGEHREVSVGPVVADRVSGWEGEAYVVETLDEDGTKLTERFRFAGNRDALHRTIVLRSKDGKSETIVQAYDRVGG
ncbi:MAG TPA: hypothetical protein VE175_14995 [Woeseiaceae bacterium]|nr:hypothetical protein [Woeseiaceae bacterium]